MYIPAAVSHAAGALLDFESCERVRVLVARLNRIDFIHELLFLRLYSDQCMSAVCLNRVDLLD
jgi:hypothetical protein